MITKSDTKLSVAVHVSSLSTWEAGQGDEKFKVTPDYTISSKTIWTTRDPTLKKLGTHTDPFTSTDVKGRSQ